MRLERVSWQKCKGKGARFTFSLAFASLTFFLTPVFKWSFTDTILHSLACRFLYPPPPPFCKCFAYVIRSVARFADQCCPLNNVWPLSMIVTKLDTVVVLRGNNPSWFSDHIVTGQVKIAGLHSTFDRSIVIKWPLFDNY